jgi:hypothetical protein
MECRELQVLLMERLGFQVGWPFPNKRFDRRNMNSLGEISPGKKNRDE